MFDPFLLCWAQTISSLELAIQIVQRTHHSVQASIFWILALSRPAYEYIIDHISLPLSLWYTRHNAMYSINTDNAKHYLAKKNNCQCQGNSS